MAIEDIRVGDLVLSQDPNTGELAFQPVLQTSQRSPEPLLKVRLARRSTDTLEGSGGHPLWVAGEGWVKLRDLKSGTWQEMLDSTFAFSPIVDQLQFGGPAPVEPDAEGNDPVPIPGQWVEV